MKHSGAGSTSPDLNQQSLNIAIPFGKNLLVLNRVRLQRCFNVYTTSITLGRRRMNVKNDFVCLLADREGLFSSYF